MFFEIAMVLIGFLFLVKGANLLIDNSSGIARKYNISPLVIGLTIVALGTSLPELFVNVISALNQNSSIAIGNIVGSNIANIALVLGIVATLRKLSLKESTIIREIPFMIFVSILFIALSFKNSLFELQSNSIGFFGGLILLIFFAVYLFFIVRQAQLEHNAVEAEFTKKFSKTKKSITFLAFFVIAGLVLLIIGADFLVDGSIAIARIFNVPEFIIAVTMIAIGTSLPELATAIVAALKNEADIALGNIIGSNIFNIAFVIGITSIIHPLSVSPSMFLSFGFMFFTSLILLPLTINQKVIGRKEGLFLLAIYGLYLLILFKF